MTDKEVNIMSEIRRGDIWMVDFGVPEDENDHKLHGIRPVVIVSNDSANRHSTVFHAVPLTSKIHKKTYLPTHIFISSFKAVGLSTALRSASEVAIRSISPLVAPPSWYISHAW